MLDLQDDGALGGARGHVVMRFGDLLEREDFVDVRLVGAVCDTCRYIVNETRGVLCAVRQLIEGVALYRDPTRNQLRISFRIVSRRTAYC